jgi:hypothetical protein
MTSRDEREREIEEQMERTEPADLSGYVLPLAMTTDDQMLFAKGLTTFRRSEFYLTHDLWEEAWHNYRLRDRRFLQGLIHVTVGCYHLQCRNAKGAHSQFGKAIDKITPCAPAHWGIDVARLIDVVSTLRVEDINCPRLREFVNAVRMAI